MINKKLNDFLDLTIMATLLIFVTCLLLFIFLYILSIAFAMNSRNFSEFLYINNKNMLKMSFLGTGILLLTYASSGVKHTFKLKHTLSLIGSILILIYISFL